MMKFSGKNIGIACILVIGATAAWNCGAAALALHVWFKPVPLGCMKLDAMTEIWLISTIFNRSLPTFAGALIFSIALAFWRNVPITALVVTALLFAVSLAPALVFWQELVRSHGPEINLWKDNIWWYIGK